MAWFKKARKPIAPTKEKASRVPEGLWVKCPGCSQIIYNKDLTTNLNVCSKCAHHFPLTAVERLRALFDDHVWVEHDKGLVSTDPLQFTDTKPYKDRLTSSLMQMAKICVTLARLDRERLPYISVLTDPTTGGVTASFAMLGDLNIAEPRALIGFAGPRVIEQTIRQKLPAGFQRSEFLLDHGMLDLVVDRRELKKTLVRCLKFFMD